MAQPLSQLGVQSAAAGAFDTSTALTLPTGTTPNHVLISVQTQNVRVRFDGTTVTTTTGILYTAGSTIALMDPNFDYRLMISNMRIISETAGAKLDAAFFT